MQIRNTAVSALVAQSMLTMMLMTTGVSGFMTPVKNHHHVTMRIESASLDGDIGKIFPSFLFCDCIDMVSY